MKAARILGCVAAVAVFASAVAAQAAEIGGHVGIAIPLMRVGSGVQGVGSNFLTVASPLGLTVKLDERLAIDFETTIATPLRPLGGRTSLTVDPGVVYNWGSFATGLRLAVPIGAAPTLGLIPLINKGFKLSGSSAWFVEAAFPMFPPSATESANLSAVLHTGIAF
jgi:hypothetical protein